MKPYLHAKISAKKFGGQPEDYMEIHNFMDSSKAHLADARHRMFLHNSYGIWLAEQVCGAVINNQRMPYIIISDGRKIQVRDVAEQHVLDDMGFIPSLQDCVANVPVPGDIAAVNHKRQIQLNGKTVILEKVL